MSAPQFATFRRFVLTGSIAAITATGAWYGAGLKVKQDFQEEKKKAQAATPLQQIEELETYRANLIQKKMLLDKKIGEVEVRKRREERRRVKEAERLEKEREIRER